MRPNLPLTEGQGGPAREGVTRLRGAFTIDIDRIRPDPKQPRREIGEEELSHLTTSVAQRGIQQPIRVWFVEGEGMFQIISGERRFRAARAAGLRAVPCIVEDPPGQGQAPPRSEILVSQIVENWQREDLNPYDLSDALKELRDEHGLSQEDMARLTGKPRSEISRFLAMQRVVPEVQREIRQSPAGRFSRRHVVALAKLKPDEQREVLGKIQAEQLTAVETEREVARHQRRTEGQALRGAPVTVRRFAVGSTHVQITFRKRTVSPDDVLEVLDRVRKMVEQELAQIGNT